MRKLVPPRLAPLLPRRQRLPLLRAAALALVLTATVTADPARALPPACVVSAGALSFDLAELGGRTSKPFDIPPKCREEETSTCVAREDTETKGGQG